MLSILEKYVYLETRLQFICKNSCLTKYSYNMSNIFQRFLFCYVFLFFVFWCKTLRPLPEPGFLLQSAGCVHLPPLHWHSPRLLENLSCGRSLWASSSGRVIKLASLSSKHSISEKKKSIIISFDFSELPGVIIKIYHLQDTLERDVAGSRSGGAQCLSRSRGIGVKGCGQRTWGLMHASASHAHVSPTYSLLRRRFWVNDMVSS